MKIGKLPNELLEKIVLPHTGASRPEVIQGPGVGADCAYLRAGDTAVVLSTDPITAASVDAGTLAVHVSCNDVASEGVAPIALMLTALFPPGTTQEDIQGIVRQASAAAESLGVQIVGGHTEITDAVTRPVLSSVAIGLSSFGGVSPTGKRISSGAAIMLTKSLGIEACAIIAKEKAAELGAVLSEEELAEAEQLSSQLSVVREGVIIGQSEDVIMHDITEGGVLGAVWELCSLLGVGCALEAQKMPISSLARKLCSFYGMDPLRLISSGSMLVIAPQPRREEIEARLAEADIAISTIGYITEQTYGIRMDGEEILPPAADEIYKL